MDALVTVPGATPWSARGDGERAKVGVVVVHGFTGNTIATRPLGQRLAAEGWTVEVPLLPGHGTDHRDLGRTTYADWLAAVDHLVDHLAQGCDQIVLVGHSLGGTLCLDLASRRTDEVVGVVAINSHVLDPHQPLAKVAPLLAYVLPYVPRDLAGLPTNDIARPDAEEGAYALVPARAANSIIRELPRVRERLAQVTQPLLVAYSPQDHTTPSAHSEALPDMVGSTDVTRLVLERSYHVPMLDYDAEKLEEAVVEFVARVTGT